MQLRSRNIPDKRDPIKKVHFEEPYKNKEFETKLKDLQKILNPYESIHYKLEKKKLFNN